MGSIGISNGNGFHENGDVVKMSKTNGCWYEEEIDSDLRWSFALRRSYKAKLSQDKVNSSSAFLKAASSLDASLKLLVVKRPDKDRFLKQTASILHTGTTQYQDIQLLDTKPFGKSLIIDGKLQSSEKDEFIYHESLVHPALLHHPSPRSIFIMGGGEGSTAREVLRHKTVEKLVMCDIDKEVVDFCKSYLDINYAAFHDPRLELIINDARVELQDRKENYDVIIGDLADPLDGGPCYQLYTKSFYEFIVKPRLSKDGIFVTQAGPAGIFSHKDVFSCIYNTLKQVFKYVVPYSAHIPSFADAWGWVMASDSPLILSSEEFDLSTEQRINGECRFLDGKTFYSASTLSKTIRKALEDETEVYTEGTAKFIYGHGNSFRLSEQML